MLTNKYAEGYPGRRYYGGCEVVDEAEQLAIDRACSLFGADHANVQPHSGSQANEAVYRAVCDVGDTVLAMPEDAGVIRVDEQTGLGVALATDGNGRYCRLDPYAGTQLVLAEAYRNVAATGARPVAVTNCLNFGSPEDPGVMWQFAEAVRGRRERG